jgi:hypothetical protein
MPLDPDAFDRALTFDASRLEALRRGWLAVADLAVWAPPSAGRLGALPRLRKRALDLGEKLAALGAARAWIPHPRERAKSALASALAASQALEQFEAALAEMQLGPERDALASAFGDLRSRAEQPIREFANLCARLLETVTREEN